MTKRCFNCQASALVASTVRLDRAIAGESFRAEVPVERCSACGEWTVALEDGRRFDLGVANALGQGGRVSPEAVKFMRKALGLRGADLAELLGVTVETVSRWETGKVPMDRDTFSTLASLVADAAEDSTRTLDRLRLLAKPRPARRRAIRLDLATVRLRPTRGPRKVSAARRVTRGRD